MDAICLAGDATPDKSRPATRPPPRGFDCCGESRPGQGRGLAERARSVIVRSTRLQALGIGHDIPGQVLDRRVAVLLDVPARGSVADDPHTVFSRAGAAHSVAPWNEWRMAKVPVLSRESYRHVGGIEIEVRGGWACRENIRVCTGTRPSGRSFRVALSPSSVESAPDSWLKA
jgi:hypothetical protein